MENPSEAYKPEDVIVQDGENKGNINDVELARVGATAEDYKRDQVDAHPLSSEFKRVFFNSGEEKTMDAYKSRVSDDAGEKALKYEIERRAMVAAKNAGAQAHIAERLASDVADSFSQMQNKLAGERLSVAMGNASVVDVDKLDSKENSITKEAWESIREKNKQEDGTYKSVMVTTYDREWMNAHPDKVVSDGYTSYNLEAPQEADSLVGTFDIANTEFEDLPKFWRGEGSDIFSK